MAVARKLAAPLFAAIAVVQAVRFVEAWPVSVNGFSVPLWASAIAAIGFAALAILVWREDRTKPSG